MAMVGNFNFFYFLRLTWEFLNLKSECGGSVCWSNNKIIIDENDQLYTYVCLHFIAENGMGLEISTAGDVYSYGIIMLEMVTGRCPSDGPFCNDPAQDNG